MPLDSVHDPAFYDAIFLPGGHAAMCDLPGNKHLAHLLGQAFTRGACRCWRVGACCGAA